MVAAVDAMYQRLDRLPDGELVALDAETAHVTADTIFRTIFSEPLSGEAARRVFHGFMAFQKHATNSWAIGVAGLPTFLSPATYRARAAGRAIRAELEALVRPRLEDWKRTGSSDKQDILASLLAAKDPETGHVFDFRELVDQVATLFLAGHETTAGALAWAVYLAAACPHVQERLHAEAHDTFADREPRFTDIKKLKFARDVFRESLRLYPSFPFIARENEHEEEMRKKTIKAGSTIAVAPWLIHRHRDYWDRPDEFDPDRYTTAKGRESLRCAYLPFSQGPRVCLGASFAMQESVLILSSLARRYRFETGPELTPEPVGRLTLRARKGIRLRIYKR
jgi:cytochrome P450